MANLKASKKDIRKTARRTIQNKAMYTKLDKAVKRLKRKEDTDVNAVYSIIDKMTGKGLIKKNKGAREKSRLAKSAK